MRLNTLLPLPLLLALTAAQDSNILTTAGFPECSIPCLQSAVSSSPCAPTDLVCQCTTGYDHIQNSAADCLLSNSKCTPDDQDKILQASIALCTGVRGAAGSAAAKPTAHVGMEGHEGMDMMDMSTSGSATATGHGTKDVGAESTSATATGHGTKDVGAESTSATAKPTGHAGHEGMDMGSSSATKADVATAVVTSSKGSASASASASASGTAAAAKAEGRKMRPHEAAKSGGCNDANPYISAFIGVITEDLKRKRRTRRTRRYPDVFSSSHSSFIWTLLEQSDAITHERWPYSAYHSHDTPQLPTTESGTAA
ncbi:hypothetical protein EJ06DRAFT_564798 [Trichodelitschia bisporula]|uniref:CFEM domain-containing protein n=1 Tax=Trichodelitschia bisporula TaxID=703511 RepID=A0A6G1HQX4_9PEZI|nr:hypothetical protein EJ06DRAFT_564798 [Trichodelitschia bisporula]